MKKCFTLLFILFSFNIAGADEEKITISDAYARATLSKEKNSAIYLRITNHSSQDDYLLSAETSISDIIEIHKTIENNGIMSMVKLDKLVIPAGKNIILAPKQTHIMLIGLKNALQKGDKFNLKLNFEKNGSKELKVEAK